jgi:hypothetical protein
VVAEAAVPHVERQQLLVAQLLALQHPEAQHPAAVQHREVQHVAQLRPQVRLAAVEDKLRVQPPAVGAAAGFN